MPSVFRFLFVVGVLGLGGYLGLYVLAVHFEPEQKEAVYKLPRVNIRK